MDAARLRDGITVAIKRVKSIGVEQQIASFLTTEDKLQDPHNHVAPILDYFTDEIDGKLQYIVMPFLRPFDNPPFYAVIEVVDFMQQILEVCLSNY